jgi:hypothetical protein
MHGRAAPHGAGADAACFRSFASRERLVKYLKPTPSQNRWSLPRRVRSGVVTWRTDPPDRSPPADHIDMIVGWKNI